MTDTRQKNVDWCVGENATWDGAKLAVLMDLRDELQSLNSQMRMIRNLFHQPGMASAIRAVIARENRNERDRKARLAKARKRAKARKAGQS